MAPGLKKSGSSQPVVSLTRQGIVVYGPVKNQAKQQSARRDSAAAQRFLERAIDLHGVLEKITIDKSGANTAAIQSVQADSGANIEMRQIKYLNNIVEQDHRAISASCGPCGDSSFFAALTSSSPASRRCPRSAKSSSTALKAKPRPQRASSTAWHSKRRATRSPSPAYCDRTRKSVSLHLQHFHTGIKQTRIDIAYCVRILDD